MTFIAQAETNWETFKNDFTSPFYDSTAKKTLMSGSTLTLLFLATKHETIDPFQENMSESKPLGEDLAEFGDLMGQAVPNLLYVTLYGSHYGFTDNSDSKRRSLNMFKASIHSGLAVNILKHTVQQERPNKLNKLSFPSGHSSTAFAFASVVGMEHSVWAAIPAYALAGVVALSRVNDNYHYLHDVTFGATIGISYGIAIYNRSQFNQDHNQAWMLLPEYQGASLVYTKFY
jgi:hypothetical protein